MSSAKHGHFEKDNIPDLKLRDIKYSPQQFLQEIFVKFAFKLMQLVNNWKKTFDYHIFFGVKNKVFIFFSCENRCQTGSTEVHCNSNCKCQNGAGCNTETGKCSCKPGWKVKIYNTVYKIFLRYLRKFFVLAKKVVHKLFWNQWNSSVYSNFCGTSFYVLTLP